MTVATSVLRAVDAIASFRVHVRYINDRCVASRVDAREQPEWPPHPGRLFMALAATYFETDGSNAEKEAERQSLEWLALQAAPRLHAVEVEERTAVVCYVPVNDTPQPNKALLQSAPGMPRSRQSRTFPTVIPQRVDSHEVADVTFEWLDAPSSSEHVAALDRLCRNVIRIGHSSSLVMASSTPPLPCPSDVDRRTTGDGAGCKLFGAPCVMSRAHMQAAQTAHTCS